MWNTSVNELIINFRGALLSLLPWLSKCKISYDEQNSYDEWDTITQTLYENMVLNSVLYSDEYKVINNSLPFAKYDMYYENYKGLAYIQIEIPERANELIIFRAFVHDDKMDTIKISIVDKNSFNTISTETIPLFKADFYIKNGLTIHPIKNLKVLL